MTELTPINCDNGVVLYVDSTLKPGDLITAYKSGFWRITEIDPRNGSTGLVKMTRVLDKNFNPKRGTDCCDQSYCRRVDPTKLIADLHAETKRQIESVLKHMVLKNAPV